MPCGKLTISKNYKCDKEGCVCIPTAGKPCLCLCQNEMGDITSCDCKCVGNKCSENCTCVGTGGYSCICVCKDEKGNIKACIGCSCVNATEGSGRSECKCAQRQAGYTGACICKGLQSCNCRGKACDADCKCGHQKCICLSSGDGSGVCACSDEKGNIKTCRCCSCEPATESEDSGNKCDCKTPENSCVCKNKQRETKCCDENNCGRESCVCVPKESNVEEPEAKTSKNQGSCVCVCENIQRKLVCCDDCKCDDTNTCDKKGCACITKTSNISIQCKGQCSCVCVCEDKEGKLVQCGDCNCEGNTCDKKTCICVTAGSTCVPLKVASGSKTSVDSCICVCKKQGEIICDADCKCDDTNHCNKDGCNCVSKDAVNTETPSTSKNCGCKQSADSCICVCKNELGKSICCTDCKCDESNTCDKKGCACVPKGSVTCVEGCTCASE